MEPNDLLSLPLLRSQVPHSKETWSIDCSPPLLPDIHNPAGKGRLLFHRNPIQVIYIQAGDDPNTMRALVNTAYPQYDTRGNGISGNANIFEWKCFLVMIHICCAVFPIYLVIMWARNEILVTLKNHTNMSMRTKGLHSQLLKVGGWEFDNDGDFQALTFQALLPGVFLLAVVTFALGLFGICNHPLLEYSTFLILGKNFHFALAPCSCLFSPTK